MERATLIEMIETGGCAGLDVAIMEALGLKYNGEVLDSLDAAIALVERVRPGIKKHLLWDEGGSSARLDWRTDFCDGDAPTPAAALVAALLKAEG